MPHMNKKPLARRGNLVQTKNRPIMNYKWIGKAIKKKFRSKKLKEKTVKIKVTLSHVNKTSQARRQFFVQIAFSHSTLKLQDAKPQAFSLHFLFRRDQNHYSNLTWRDHNHYSNSKNHENV